MGRYWQGLQIIVRVISYYFQNQANITSFEIGLNIFFEARLIVFLTDELTGFIDIQVPY